jgi:hypothetical protein
MNPTHAIDGGQPVRMRCTGCACKVAEPYTTIRAEAGHLLAFLCPPCDDLHDRSPQFRALVDQCARRGFLVPDVLEAFAAIERERSSGAMH